MRIDRVSGLDDLFYDVTVRNASGAPVTTGTVTVRLCAYGTTTPLVEGDEASVALTHQGAGRWTGLHNDQAVAIAIANVSLHGLFDRIVFVEGRGARRVARCQRVNVVSAQ